MPLQTVSDVIDFEQYFDHLEHELQTFQTNVNQRVEENITMLADTQAQMNRTVWEITQERVLLSDRVGLLESKLDTPGIGCAACTLVEPQLNLLSEKFDAQSQQILGLVAEIQMLKTAKQETP